MSWIIDEYKLTYGNDLYVGTYYAYDDDTYRYYVNGWDDEVKEIHDILAKKGLLREREAYFEREVQELHCGMESY